MLIKMKSFTILLALWWAPSIVQAQNETLEHYIREGLENNLALKQEDLSVEKGLEALKQARGRYMPNIAFHSSYTLADGGRSIAIPIGDLLNPVYSSLNQLTEADIFPTDLQNANEQFLPNQFHDTRLQIAQPLFNPDIVFNYRAQEALVASRDAKREVLVQDLTMEIKTAYYQYLTTIDALEIYRSTEKLLQELWRVNTKLVENDKTTMDAVYRAEFELSDLYSQIAEANRLMATSKSYFNFLLNRALSDSITVDKEFALLNDTGMPIESMQHEALRNRQEIDQLTHAISANENLLALHKNARLPKLSLGANLGYQGADYRFGSTQDYYLMQFSLSVPLFQGLQNKSKIQESKIALNMQQTKMAELKQQIRHQVVDAYRQVEAGKYLLRSRQAALKSAKKSFDIISRKYLENQITLLDLLDARTKYTNAQLELILARYALLEKEAKLERTLALNQ
jgi:outer membrane protein TolC